MHSTSTDLLPLENELYINSKNGEYFPAGSTEYFNRYKQIKAYMEREIYKWVGSGTSAEDQGVYTDHSIDHFNAVIRFAGKLIDINEDNKSKLSPYEIYMTLVSILLHDAGNIEGRRGHEKKALKIFLDIGKAVCPDHFEAKFIASIAEAHGGERVLPDNSTTKDTISHLKEEDSYGSISYRPQLIAALVRFADEICESRNRAARFLLDGGKLPKWSEIYHKYADTITSVEVDIKGKCINLKYDIGTKSLSRTFGKGSKDNIRDGFLIDEIFSRLEKMYHELHYCRRFMIDEVRIDKIKASIDIYDDDRDWEDPNYMSHIDQNILLLEERGYPSGLISLKKEHQAWIEKTRQKTSVEAQ